LNNRFNDEAVTLTAVEQKILTDRRTDTDSIHTITYVIHNIGLGVAREGGMGSGPQCEWKKFNSLNRFSCRTYYV